MKRRPNALDRELADVWRRMALGNYAVEVRTAFEQAPIKAEGGCLITLEDKQIEVVPIGNRW